MRERAAGDSRTGTASRRRRRSTRLQREEGAREAEHPPPAVVDYGGMEVCLFGQCGWQPIRSRIGGVGGVPEKGESGGG